MKAWAQALGTAVTEGDAPDGGTSGTERSLHDAGDSHGATGASSGAYCFGRSQTSLRSAFGRASQTPHGNSRAPDRPQGLAPSPARGSREPTLLGTSYRKVAPSVAGLAPRRQAGSSASRGRAAPPEAAILNRAATTPGVPRAPCKGAAQGRITPGMANRSRRRSALLWLPDSFAPRSGSGMSLSAKNKREPGAAFSGVPRASLCSAGCAKAGPRYCSSFPSPLAPPQPGPPGRWGAHSCRFLQEPG